MSAFGLALKLATHSARSRLTGEPYLLNIHLTWKCDSRCRHCGIWARRDRREELRLPDYRRMFQGFGKAIGIVSFTGGQPTLKPDLNRIMLSAVELLPRLCIMHYTTNALHPAKDTELADKVLAAHPRLPLRISISLDGTGTEHDEVRGVPGNYAKVEELFARLRERRRRHPNLRLGFSTTIGGFNLAGLGATAAAFPAKDYHTFDFFHKSRTYYGETAIPGAALDGEQRRGAAATLARRKAGGIEDILNRAFLALAAGPYLRPACAAGMSTVSIYPNGEIRRCLFLDQPGGGHSPRCRRCWNTCNAYATMAAHPLTTALSLLRAAAAGGLRGR
ncbi:MAG: radical SAM protein [Elusimicrobiota bacterium]